MVGILGKKVGMTQLFDQGGEVVPVTVIEAGPCFVTQIKTQDRDGYQAVQLGYDEVKPRRLTQGEQGHLKANDLPMLRHLKEIRVKADTESPTGGFAQAQSPTGHEAQSPTGGEAQYQVGQRITVDMFEVGEYVDVVGTSKGRGFAGTIKRHRFHRQPKTHGQSDRERKPGSIGATTGTGHVFKGKRMAGRMGNERVTSQNLRVALVDPERNLLAVRGSVPGPKGGLVLIKPARKQG